MKLCLLQSDIVWENIPANLAHFGQLIDRLETADLLILPEMFATGFTMNPQGYAQNEAGSIMQFLKQKAADKNAAIATSFACLEQGKYYNRLVFVKPDGQFIGYDKRHLFSFAGEDWYYTPGKHRVIIDFKGFRIMPQVCYDLRFPVWSRNRGDYDLLVYVANWPERRRKAWRILLQARAHENQAYVAGVNRVGSDGNDVSHSGDSMLIDPRGNALIDLSDGQSSIACAQIDIEKVRRLRSRFPAAEDADDFVLKL